MFFLQFEEIHNLDLSSRFIITKSKCNNFEYLYFFLNQYQLNSLINIINNNNIEILDKKDFKNDLLKIINENNLEKLREIFEDKDSFDFLVKEFYLNYVSKDMILDKMLNIGKSFLTEIDYEILSK